MKTMYEVTANYAHGFRSDTFEADSSRAALKMAKKAIKFPCGYKATKWIVRRA